MKIKHAFSPRAKRSACSIGSIFSALGLALLLFSSCDPQSEHQPAPSSAAGPEIIYNAKISFAQSGTSAPMRFSGWSKAEENFTWTEGKSATLAMRVPPTQNPVTLRMTLNGLIKEPELPAQPVEVYVNDRKIADWQVGERAPFSALIPPEFTKSGGSLAFTFKMPKAISPKELGQGEDPRVLGICVVDLELSDS